MYLFIIYNNELQKTTEIRFKQCLTYASVYIKCEISEGTLNWKTKTF